ncbi:MAG TPA: DUF1707 domain-containing protein [Pseudonocardiaceae bacterium]
MDDQTPRDQLRAADADRERVAEHLRSAHAEGRLDLVEYDDRVQRAWAARTYGDLDMLTADLPSGWSAPSPHRSRSGPPLPAEGGGRERRHRHAMHARATLAAWLSLSVINVMIWAVVCLTTWRWIYPWWIWVAVPWGAVLFMRWISERGDGSTPAR